MSNVPYLGAALQDRLGQVLFDHLHGNAAALRDLGVAQPLDAAEQEDRAALVRQLLYRSFPRLQAAPCLPLLLQAGKIGGHVDAAEIGGLRSEERRVGKECRSTCRSRWARTH